MKRISPRRWQITFLIFLFITLFLFVSEYKSLNRIIFTKFHPSHPTVLKFNETEEEFMARIEKRMIKRRENVKNTCRSLSKFTFLRDRPTCDLYSQANRFFQNLLLINKI